VSFRNKASARPVTSAIGAPADQQNERPCAVRAQTRGEIMRETAITIIALVSMTSNVFAGSAPTPTPSLRQIVDEIAARGFADVHNGDITVRLVRDQSQCARGEELTPIWINFADARQHLTGYACKTSFE
jgi:hypothetical protein